MHKLLVCIPFHYSDQSNYTQYLKQVIDEFLTNYTKHVEVTIIIDTNCDKGLECVFSLYPDIIGKIIHVKINRNLGHPFFLTWQHRRHIQENIDKYDVFMYVECDIKLPYENYENFLENFDLIWPRGVPILFRIEFNRKGEMHSSDAEKHHLIKKSELVDYGGKKFVHQLDHPLPYHAMWICPQKVLKSLIGPDFVKETISRETAASFLIWEVKKDGHLEIENRGVSPKAYVYHLPNNYASVEGRLGQIKAKDAVQIIDD